MTDTLQEIPRYKCHKIVQALRIAEIQMDDEADPNCASAFRDATITPADDGHGPFRVSAHYMCKHWPQVGGYYVVDEDGYPSFSPAAAFESGYSRLDDNPLLNFGQALELLKQGFKVARLGWNGKGMWLALSGGMVGRIVSADNFWSQANRDYAISRGGSAHVLPCITMKTATGEILMGWLASQTDMLAEDWVIVEDDCQGSDAK